MQSRTYDKVGYTLIKTFTCNKLSDRAKGQLHYQLWQNNDDQSFGLALSKNESSGGFSSELIHVEQIITVISILHKNAQPFHSTALKNLFIGKSVNNASFFAAVLVDQGVIRLHPQTSRLLEITEDFVLWPLSLSEQRQSNDSPVALEPSVKTSNKRNPKTKTTNEQEDDHAIHQDQL